MKKTFYRLLFLLTMCAQTLASDNGVADIDKVIHKSINYLSQEQFSGDSGYYIRGEWPVQMKSYMIPALVGLGRHFARPSQEPTAFATASIMNLLSEAYLIDPQLQPVPSILEKALPSFERYREGDVFFYYPLSEFQGHKLHVPLDPHYVPRKMMSLALVPPDADTTAVGFTALAFTDLILQQKPISEFTVPAETLNTFERFRDINRDPHPYNRLNGGVKNSGAYLTWLWDENAKSSSFMKSMSDGPGKGYRIVFGRNDVDCVVNANVLRLMSLTNNQNQNGYADSCKLLNDSITKSRNLETQAKYCGLYYPNTFGAIYSISNAYKAGASCLNKSREHALELILNRQNEDGSWANDEGIGREDRVQSTASAVGAMLNYIGPKDRRYEAAIRRGAAYLISQSKNKDDSRTYWKGEVFFSAGPMARNTILWRSNSYTTALTVLSLVKAKNYLNAEVAP